MRPAKVPAIDVRDEPPARFLPKSGDKITAAIRQLGFHVVHVIGRCCLVVVPHNSSSRRTITFAHATCQSYHMIKYGGFGICPVGSIPDQITRPRGEVFYPAAHLSRSRDVYMRR